MAEIVDFLDQSCCNDEDNTNLMTKIKKSITWFLGRLPKVDLII